MHSALYANLAAVMLSVLGWDAMHHWVRHLARKWRNAVFGILMGAAAISAMCFAVPVASGIQFDLRQVPVALAGWFGGPLAAAIAGSAAIAFRIVLGGQGATIGAASVAATGLFAVVLHYLMRPKGVSVARSAVLAFAVADVFVVMTLLLPGEAAMQLIGGPGWVVALLIASSTLLASLMVQHGAKMSAERDLLDAALQHSPDYLYVKDTDLRFVSVNTTVAEHLGFESHLAVKGKTDFDVDDHHHAQTLALEERQILAGGSSLIDKEELIETTAGKRWFVTTKRPVTNLDGETIGLVGVTRDITEEKALNEQLGQSQSQLSAILEEMTDGVALFNENGILQFCNKQYSELFPKTAYVRVAGADLRQILRQSVLSGEQLNVDRDIVEHWVDHVVEGLGMNGEQVIELFDGRWLKLRTRPIPGGMSLVHVSDISSEHAEQQSLENLAVQLQQLAKTDPLTGLLNRRALESRLDDELRRTQRSGLPLSLLMIDADNFKRFNDTYGHVAGDACLKTMAECIVAVCRRPADFAARFGGEEFVIVLPECDEVAAANAAARLQGEVRAAAIEHKANDTGLVTVSIGIATYSGQAKRRVRDELVSRADEALYVAKSSGRNRFTTWSGPASQLSETA